MKLDKTQLKILLKKYTDELFNRYYITNPPTIIKHDRVELGYSGSHNPKNSIHFQFKTTKPSEKDLEIFIRVFTETLIEEIN